MAYERRREGVVLLAEREWREQPASMKWLLGLNILLVFLYLAELWATTATVNLDLSTWGVAVAPILVLLIAGIWITWVGNAAGVGILFAVDALIAISTVAFHMVPGSPGFFGGVAVTDATTVAMAGMALLVPLVAFLGLLVGILAMMDLYDRLALPDVDLAE